ncbi:VanZ family protein [Bifidobacterium dolichotidis]|uniref:VanZ family protein n=1 Tax=Bifidobacterium dolichotidis TaxID=2306976 RepID=UPI001F49F057|nr:VanZ family protein [Bifidobacterium dolichotidis]
MAISYHRNHTLSWSASITAYLSVLYPLGLLAFTLYPMPDDPVQFCATHHFGPQLDLWLFIPQILHGGLSDILQLLLNVIFFMPLGFMLQRWAKWPWWISFIFAFGCSLFIETSQLTGFWGVYPCAYRHFDVDDMLTNTTGAIVGYGIGAIYTHFVPQHAKRVVGTVKLPGIVHRVVSFALDLFLTLLMYFTLSVGWMWLFVHTVMPLEDGTFIFLHMHVGIDLMQAGVWVCGIVPFVLFELLIPLANKGQTLGGMYTHMTIETRVRHGWQRALFYAVRTLVLGVMFMMIISFNSLVWWFFAILLVFWIIAHRMPWDLLPATQPKRPDMTVISA